MNFLSSEGLAAYLMELWDDEDFAFSTGYPIRVDWDLWSDAGSYPNNLAARPLPDGPWYIAGVNGSVKVAFSVPVAWVTEANGEPSFKFDDEGPCEIAAFLRECEDLYVSLTEAVKDHVRGVMEYPGGNTDDSMDEFAVVFGEVTFAPAGHETRVEIETRIESI